MALTANEKRTLTNAIKGNYVVKFRYYPQNVNDKTKIYSKAFRFANAIKYKFDCLLGFYVKGASYSWNAKRNFDSRFRLYKLEHMYDLTVLKNFAPSVGFSKELKVERIDSIFIRKYAKNEFENFDIENDTD